MATTRVSPETEAPLTNNNAQPQDEQRQLMLPTQPMSQPQVSLGARFLDAPSQFKTPIYMPFLASLTPVQVAQINDSCFEIFEIKITPIGNLRQFQILNDRPKITRWRQGLSNALFLLNQQQLLKKALPLFDPISQEISFNLNNINTTFEYEKSVRDSLPKMKIYHQEQLKAFEAQIKDLKHQLNLRQGDLKEAELKKQIIWAKMQTTLHQTSIEIHLPLMEKYLERYFKTFPKLIKDMEAVKFAVSSGFTAEHGTWKQIAIDLINQIEAALNDITNLSDELGNRAVLHLGQGIDLFTRGKGALIQTGGIKAEFGMVRSFISLLDEILAIQAVRVPYCDMKEDLIKWNNQNFQNMNLWKANYNKALIAVKQNMLNQINQNQMLIMQYNINKLYSAVRQLESENQAIRNRMNDIDNQQSALSAEGALGALMNPAFIKGMVNVAGKVFGGDIPNPLSGIMDGGDVANSISGVMGGDIGKSISGVMDLMKPGAINKLSNPKVLAGNTMKLAGNIARVASCDFTQIAPLILNGFKVALPIVKGIRNYFKSKTPAKPNELVDKAKAPPVNPNDNPDKGEPSLTEKQTPKATPVNPKDGPDKDGPSLTEKQMQDDVKQINDLKPGDPIPPEAMNFINEAEFERNKAQANQLINQMGNMIQDEIQSNKKAYEEAKAKYIESQKTITMLEELERNLTRLTQMRESEELFLQVHQYGIEEAKQTLDDSHTQKLQFYFYCTQLDLNRIPLPFNQFIIPLRSFLNIESPFICACAPCTKPAPKAMVTKTMTENQIKRKLCKIIRNRLKIPNDSGVSYDKRLEQLTVPDVMEFYKSKKVWAVLKNACANLQIQTFKGIDPNTQQPTGAQVKNVNFHFQMNQIFRMLVTNMAARVYPQ